MSTATAVAGPSSTAVNYQTPSGPPASSTADRSLITYQRGHDSDISPSELIGYDIIGAVIGSIVVPAITGILVFLMRRLFRRRNNAADNGTNDNVEPAVAYYA